MATNPDEGIEKSAMLLLSLGEDEAAEILKHLGPREVQKLGQAMASLKAVPRERIEAGVKAEEIARSWEPTVAEFVRLREKFLLY